MNPIFFDFINASGTMSYITRYIIKEARLGQASLSYYFKVKTSAILNHITNGATKSNKKIY